MYICTGFTTCICPAFYAVILLINIIIIIIIIIITAQESGLKVVENGCEDGGEVHDLGALGQSNDKQVTPVGLDQLDLQLNTQTTHETVIITLQTILPLK